MANEWGIWGRGLRPLMGNMGAQSEISYEEDRFDELDGLDGEFFLLALNSLNS